jgi:hypothetical protein
VSIVDFSLAMSASSWSASFGAPDAALTSFFCHSRYSSLCQPVHLGSSSLAKSSTRASTEASMSSTSPAMGSMVSHACRDDA